MWRQVVHLGGAAIMAGATLLAGCASHLDGNLIAATNAGHYGGARAALQGKLTDDPSDRDYILDRLRLLILTLADGSPEAAEEVANQTFRLLRTQGLNADRTTAAVVFNEGVKIWKGEPFEQAMGYYYIALQKAQRGEWDNARAAAGSSLFLLKDFGVNERGERMSGVDIATRAAAEDREYPGDGDRYIDRGYQPIKTDFALGYMLNGVANLAIGRDDEASDNFHEAATLDKGLSDVVAALESGECNTVLVVEYGRGPVKVNYGPDNAFAQFKPQSRSDPRPLEVSVDGGRVLVSAAPRTLDLNRMASRQIWNNLEDVRRAKSVLGTALLYGGMITAASANQRNDDKRHTQQAIGIGLAILGGLMKANAAADTRHCEFLPQRVYIVPVRIEETDSLVTLNVPGDAGSTMRLAAIDPPARGQKIQLRYARLNPWGSHAWASSGQVLYANDRYDQQVEGDGLPYILGGRCVRSPSPEVLEYYQQSGNLLDMTTNDLRNLYREEGIALSIEDQQGGSRQHVLEGGDSLVCPLSGTAGYARLFGQLHSEYQPRSRAVTQLKQRLDQKRQ